MAFVHFSQKKLRIKLLLTGSTSSGHKDLFSSIFQFSKLSTGSSPQGAVSAGGFGALQMQGAKFFDYETEILAYTSDLESEEEFPQGLLVGLDGIVFVFDRSSTSFASSIRKFSLLKSIVRKMDFRPSMTVLYTDSESGANIGIDSLQENWNQDGLPYLVGSVTSTLTAANVLNQIMTAVMNDGQQHFREMSL